MARTTPRARPVAEEARAGQVQSISRALAILRALSESGDGMTLSDVAQIVGLPASTTHRLLTTLQQERFVRFDGTAHLGFDRGADRVEDGGTLRTALGGFTERLRQRTAGKPEACQRGNDERTPEGHAQAASRSGMRRTWPG